MPIGLKPATETALGLDFIPKVFIRNPILNLLFYTKFNILYRTKTASGVFVSSEMNRYIFLYTKSISDVFLWAKSQPR